MELKQFVKEVDAFEAKINELQSRLAAAEAERDQARAKSSRLEARCGDLQEEVDRLKVENGRLQKIITEEVNLLHDEGEHVWADCLESDLYDKQALEVPSGKD